VLLAGRRGTRPKQDREKGYGDTETQGHRLWSRLLGEHLCRLGDGSNLQCNVGQCTDEHEHGDEDTGQLTAVAKGEQIGERGELVFPSETQDREQQDRGQEKCQRRPKIDREKIVAVGRGKTHVAIVGPGGGVYA